jgi:hypothetical protein
MLTDMDKGVRVSGAVVNIAVVGAANATVIFIRSAFAQQVGTKSFITRKLMVRNNAGGNLWLALGTGVGGLFANALPPVRVLNVLDNEWQEFDLPAVELFANMTAFPDALVAGGSVDVQVEVEERG